MEFTLLKASDWYFNRKVTINTLDDLKELQKNIKLKKYLLVEIGIILLLL